MTDTPASPRRAGDPAGHPLEECLNQVESQLASLGTALGARDLDAIGRHSQGLQQALTQAVDRFSLAAKVGQVPEPLRRRLARASGLVAAQRESLARATAALDRAIDVLMPRQGPACYSREGQSERCLLGGVIQA